MFHSNKLSFPPPYSKSSPCPACHSLSRSSCPSQHEVTSTILRPKPLSASQTKEVIVRSVEELSAASSSSCCEDDDGGDDETRLKQTMTHRLSGTLRENTSVSPHSPVLQPSGLAQQQAPLPLLHLSYFSENQTCRGVERGSNYGVTLAVGDKTSEGLGLSRNTERPLLALGGWQQEICQDSQALRSYTGLPRPRNKSSSVSVCTL
ncbi:uncharacterized protein LOC117811970 [Xyrichtys novacula]|uniref:Uncharacterized protein LOC117811970 n=1 Tax=Xyrichtys novacula TaxID=13765 RepID=A0AAV1G3B3_XYRNO|nr:uncharacterized protein LOC117811970 [Xyrichtys novacula]